MSDQKKKNSTPAVAPADTIRDVPLTEALQTVAPIAPGHYLVTIRPDGSIESVDPGLDQEGAEELPQAAFGEYETVQGFRFPRNEVGFVFLLCETRDVYGRQTCGHATEYIVTRLDGRQELCCAEHVGPGGDRLSYTRFTGVRRYPDGPMVLPLNAGEEEPV